MSRCRERPKRAVGNALRGVPGSQAPLGNSRLEAPLPIARKLRVTPEPGLVPASSAFHGQVENLSYKKRRPPPQCRGRAIERARMHKVEATARRCVNRLASGGHADQAAFGPLRCFLSAPQQLAPQARTWQSVVFGLEFSSGERSCEGHLSLVTCHLSLVSGEW